MSLKRSHPEKHFLSDGSLFTVQYSVNILGASATCNHSRKPHTISFAPYASKNLAYCFDLIFACIKVLSSLFDLIAVVHLGSRVVPRKAKFLLTRSPDLTSFPESLITRRIEASFGFALPADVALKNLEVLYLTLFLTREYHERGFYAVCAETVLRLPILEQINMCFLASIS